MPLNVNAANADVVKYIDDEYSEYFDIEYNTDYDVIVARGEINNIISDKTGIESFNAGISYILFSNEMEQLDEGTALMFIGYAEDISDEERSQAVIYYTPEDIRSLRALGMIMDREAYRYASRYSITSQFSHYLESYDVNRPANENDPIDKLVIFSLGMTKDSSLPDVR